MFESPSSVSFQCSHFLPGGREKTQLWSKTYISFCSNTHGLGFLQQYLRNIKYVRVYKCLQYRLLKHQTRVDQHMYTTPRVALYN
ncbi:unnamed protein product, partial [Brassica rapa subsp. trilocularis]